MSMEAGKFEIDPAIMIAHRILPLVHAMMKKTGLELDLLIESVPGVGLRLNLAGSVQVVPGIAA